MAQTKRITTTESLNGSFLHRVTRSSRRRAGMPGAYMRHVVHATATVAGFDTGWVYIPRGKEFKWWE